MEVMEVFVTIEDQSESFTLPVDVTITEFTNTVSEKTGKHRKALDFSFGGIDLKDGTKTLSQFGLKPGCTVNTKVTQLPGVDFVGPFALNPGLKVKYEFAGKSYLQLKGPPEYITELGKVTGERELFFQVSPKNKVTLPDDIRIKASIPIGDNVYFSWIYPFVKTKYSTAKKIGRMFASTDPIITLFVFGGFIYIDDEKKILQVNGVRLGEPAALVFEGPYNMDPKCFEVIHAKGRFQEITLSLEGCKTFCWFRPNEHEKIKKKIYGVPPFTDDKGNEIPISDGAFGYQCDGGKYRMFRIRGGGE